LLVIAGTFSDVDIRYLLRQGVYGCLVQPISSEELTSQLRRYHDGHPVFARPVLRRILELFNQLQGHEVYHPDHQLTERENEIARYLCKGLTYKQIGQQLNLSVYTVNQHLKKMYLKKGVNSRHELTSMIFSRES
jgi:DNA-binding NarL/FixJ family response regulator